MRTCHTCTEPLTDTEFIECEICANKRDIKRCQTRFTGLAGMLASAIADKDNPEFIKQLKEAMLEEQEEIGVLSNG